MIVLFLPEIRQYFKELEDILLEKEYFSFEESAVQYVRKLILDIEYTLPSRTSKIAAILHFGKTKIQSGMYFSINMRKTEKLFTW